MLDRMLRLLGFDSFQSSFEFSGVFVDFLGTLCEQLPVDFVPVLRVRRLVGFVFPLGDVSLDEFHPDL